MSDCEVLDTCPFFNDKIQNMPSLSNQYKKDYCKDNFEKCARHMVLKALGKPKVPADLFPNQMDRAEAIIKQG